MIARRLACATALAAGTLSGTARAADSSLLEDFKNPPYLWTSSPKVSLSRVTIPAGDPLALPGQGPVEDVLSVSVPLRVEARVLGRGCRDRKDRDGWGHDERGRDGRGRDDDDLLTVLLPSTPGFDATSVDHTTVRLQDAAEAHTVRSSRRHSSEVARHEEDADHDGDLDLVFHFRCDELDLPRKIDHLPLNGLTFSGQWITAGGTDARFDRPLAASANWSTADGLHFWYYGRGTGDTITVELRDNRAPDPGPSGWRLAWRDEFDGRAGQPPDPAHWTHEIGDGTANGIPGWGNNEREYYTDAPENAAQDGKGNLAITARKADGSLSCYYGPCEFTSARLISRYKAEFAHGRIEARMRVPAGKGLWPAFWSLGTDIGEAGWPQSGEIDFMEFVGREPNQVFGTIHGPGYSGASSFGGARDLGKPVSDRFHVFAVEWQPGRIDWFVDNVLYLSATPADVAPNPWVFDHPFFLIMNLALGGYFPGPVGDDTVFPAKLLVDYVRVFQAPDTAERFEASFKDDFTGWQDVALPFASFDRSHEQPCGAPADGLGLTEVWGYGFRLPDNGISAGPLLLDGIRLIRPASVVVTQAGDSGPGSLRQALDAVASGGLVSFDPVLAGVTIQLTSGPLWISGKTVVIDASAAPGLTVSGGHVDRMLIVDPGAGATVSHVAFADGYAWDVAGGVLNNGTLTLDHVVVRDNFLNSGDNQWWKGGGGIFVGDGATLTVTHSTVTGNRTNLVDGGGIYARQGTTVHIEASTVSGNVAGNVGGGIRMLGSGTIVNSTVSGNTASAWHGGGLFHTDGVLGLTNTTITANTSQGGQAAAVFVGTFTDASATLTLTNSIVAGNVGEGCLSGFFGAGPVTLASGGHNVFALGSGCNPSASDQEVADAGLEGLADNGGPTLTHALLDSSPAKDTADGAFCPATDQRGVARPQGPQCDAGAFEKEP